MMRYLLHNSLCIFKAHVVKCLSQNKNQRVLRHNSMIEKFVNLILHNTFYLL